MGWKAPLGEGSARVGPGGLPTRRGGIWQIPQLLLTVLAAFAVHAPAHKPVHHHHRCTTIRCGRLWAKHHPPKFVFSPFSLCVANHESGTGTVATQANARFNTIDWHFDSEGYEGAYNWVNSTWLAMGGGKYAQHAYSASPEQQTRIFDAHANSTDWPESVPACE